MKISSQYVDIFYQNLQKKIRLICYVFLYLKPMICFELTLSFTNNPFKYKILSVAYLYCIHRHVPHSYTDVNVICH
jgi:hypothetical protein